MLNILTEEERITLADVKGSKVFKFFRGKIISTQRFFVILGTVSLWMIVLLVILEIARRENAEFKMISPLEQVLQNFSLAFDEPRDRLKVCWMISAVS